MEPAFDAAMTPERFAKILRAKLHWLEGFSDAIGNTYFRHQIEVLRKDLRRFE